ncbi:hypothetical protein, partial [Actinoplanes ianthinogenes]|uniref:hypothetical protein n=1 Tax=Actinoplanes ianthinogenes TaxID=122358 RepID=UPI001E2D3D0D
PLVGQTPSVLASRFVDYLIALDHWIRYSGEGEPCSPDLGVVLRVQRAGDRVLSRPIMVAEVWTDRCWDGHEGLIPKEEWRTF